LYLENGIFYSLNDINTLRIAWAEPIILRNISSDFCNARGHGS